MKICAKLAYSQLKVNRSRSLWTLAAVCLSTALTFSVCTLAVCANAMLVELLGESYGEYGGTYRNLLLIPAMLMGLIIAAMAVVVISNVFRASAAQRAGQFGILKCVGATERQIRATVIYESLFLSSVGIPAGLVLGTALSYCAVKITNSYLGELNALVNLMVQEVRFSLPFVISPPALLFCALISLLCVFISALDGARRAARTPAIESVRGVGETDMSGEKIARTFPLIRRIFGFEGELAARNLRRSRKSFSATVTSLAVAVILTVTLGVLSGAAGKIMDYMHPEMYRNIIAEYSSARTYRDVVETGREESVYLRPIESEKGEEITKELEEYGIDIFGVGTDLETYHCDVDEKYLSEDMQGLETDEFDVEIITLDEENYKKLCETAGVDVGGNILLNAYSYNKSGHTVNITPYTEELGELKLEKADNSISVFEVDGAITESQIPTELVYPNPAPVRLVVPEATLRSYSWYAAAEDEQDFIDFADALLKEEFPERGESYQAEGFNTRVYRIDDYMKVMNIAVVIASVFLYSFVALLMLIGLTNVVSTISANVLLRAREFAVLQSVGMTPEGLRSMLKTESLLCCGKALIIGLPLAVALSFLINLPISAVFPTAYELPWISLLLCAAGVFLLTRFVTLLALRKLNGQNIIETIRS